MFRLSNSSPARNLVIFLLIYFQQDAIVHSLFISGKLLYMFRVVSPPETCRAVFQK